MHSASVLTSDSFTFAAGDSPATLDDLLPGLDEHDRLGIVVRDPYGLVGASTLLLAAVTRFFDRQRELADDFFIYPDYFAFHVGQPLGLHGWLEIWPDHKEVVVPADDPEALLRAINDRGVTRLLVPDRPVRPVEYERQTRSSAESRIVTALAYSSDGRVRDADVTVRGNAVTESYVELTFDEPTGLSSDVRSAAWQLRHELADEEIPLEAYRRLTLEDAFGMLAGPVETPV